LTSVFCAIEASKEKLAFVFEEIMAEKRKRSAHCKDHRPARFTEVCSLRDFLHRRDVPFAWVELTSDDVRQNSVKRCVSAVGEGAIAVAFVHKYRAEGQVKCSKEKRASARRQLFDEIIQKLASFKRTLSETGTYIAFVNERKI
jgi:hypothetical protein